MSASPLFATANISGQLPSCAGHTQREQVDRLSIRTLLEDKTRLEHRRAELLQRLQCERAPLAKVLPGSAGRGHRAERAAFGQRRACWYRRPSAN
jgi:hypothetical protein